MPARCWHASTTAITAPPSPVARATVDAQQATIDNLTQQIERAAARGHRRRAANVAADQAALTFADQTTTRYASLSRTGAGTVQEAQQARPRSRSGRPTLERDTAALGVAQKQIDVLRAQLTQAQATLAQRQAGLHQAELNLSYTTITAPVDGTVGARTLRVGQYVQAGTQLMAVVPLQAGLCHRELQGDAADRRACRPAGDDRRRHVSRRRRAWRGEQYRAGQRRRSSRCCRPTTRPATSPRSCSASR